MKFSDKNSLFPGVKNYYFIHGSDGPAQFVLTWGTTGHPFRVNKVSAKHPNTAVLFWGYHPKTGKKLLFNSAGRTEVSAKGDIRFASRGKGYFLGHGDTKIIFGEEYKPAELFAPAGLEMGVNEFREFHGELFGHRVSGRSLLQRYKVWAPFVSWDWFLFHGEKDGSLFRVLNAGTSMDYGGRKYSIKLSAGNGRLRIEGPQVSLATKPYAREDVFMAGLGKFRYTEFFVRVKGEVDGKDIDATGIVEEARGFIV